MQHIIFIRAKGATVLENMNQEVKKIKNLEGVSGEGQAGHTNAVLHTVTLSPGTPRMTQELVLLPLVDV